MTTVLYALAVLTPLVLAATSLGLMGVRWIERRVEDRVRAEHGLPPRPARPAQRIEDVETRPATRTALRRRLSEALDADAGLPPVAAARPAPRPPAADLPWPLRDAGVQPAPEEVEPIRVTRTRSEEPEVAPVPAPEPLPVPEPVAAPAPAPVEIIEPVAPALPTLVSSPAAIDLPAPAPVPARDADGARAALARAAATLQELERAAEQADRYGTKECPECDRSVRLSARVCPHCRYRMAPEPGSQDLRAV